MEVTKSSYCSFCGKDKKEVEHLIKNNELYICNECIELCYEIITFGANHQDNLYGSNFKPMNIKQHLDEYVIGQHDAKKKLSVAVYNHYKKINSRFKSDKSMKKSNVLLIGPTGTGKTYLIETLSKILDVPLVIVDATSLTQTGYAGNDVDSMILRLLEMTNYNIERAEKGIVYIDEIDKLSRKDASISSGRDINGEGVQQSLLNILEGTKLTFEDSRNTSSNQSFQIDTTNILFICSGAFDGLERIVNSRMRKFSMGFVGNINIDSKIKDSCPKISYEDILEFGLIPEFIGRLPVIAYLNPLTKDDLFQILKCSKDSLTIQYEKLFKIDNVDLKFTDGALEKIAQMAINRKIGARSLKSILEELLCDIMYSTPSNDKIREIVIDEDAVEC